MCFSSSQVEANPFSGDTSQTISDDDSDAPWEVRKNPPGESSSGSLQLKKLMQPKYWQSVYWMVENLYYCSPHLLQKKQVETCKGDNKLLL